MPTPATARSLFAQLPALMKQLLLHEENTDINIEIKKANNLTPEQGEKMMQIIRKIIFITITPRELVDVIQREVGLDNGRARKLALDLLGRRFLPMEWYIGNVERLIRDLGGKVEDYLATAKKIYPEVYEPHPTSSLAANQPAASATETISPMSPSAQEISPYLANLEDRLTNFKGRAEVLLRLTGLSQQIDEAIKTKQVSTEHGQELLRILDTLSYAVNTQDLNPLEIQAIKRRLTKVVTEVSGWPK